MSSHLRTLLLEPGQRSRVGIKHHELLPCGKQSCTEVVTHVTQTNQSDFHCFVLK